MAQFQVLDHLINTLLAALCHGCRSAIFQDGMGQKALSYLTSYEVGGNLVSNEVYQPVVLSCHKIYPFRCCI